MSPNNRSQLERFFFDASNSHGKESLINNKLLFDLKLAAANRGYFLNVYLPEVDQDGFDMIFDDHDLVVKTQLKTVMKGAGTTNWNIHKRILRPTIDQIKYFGLELSPYGEGVGGGVILIEIDAAQDFSVRYFYTDLVILCGFRDNLLKVSRPPSNDTISRFFTKLYNGSGKERISVPKSLFLEARSPESLLALMGLHNNISTSIWRFHVMNMAEPQVPARDLPAPFGMLKKHVNEEIEKLSPRIQK
ncbi:hypothetical protein [Desulfonatronovibrio hydrogenovorans]|uniref:hypothetical protein n=1 Tax=Desulfonatronovibrio hydrogenovorans TaxID=53245 RepID=UPI00048FD26E|nr:hypothetical protein [Desulfonatronovibrio hydrogenovorans]